MSIDQKLLEEQQRGLKRADEYENGIRYLALGFDFKYSKEAEDEYFESIILQLDDGEDIEYRVLEFTTEFLSDSTLVNNIEFFLLEEEAGSKLSTIVQKGYVKNITTRLETLWEVYKLFRKWEGDE